MEDRDLFPFFQFIEKKLVPEDDSFAMEVLRNVSHYAINDNGVLVYSSNPEDQTKPFKVCVPKLFKISLEESHDSLWSGCHLGRDKTIDKICLKVLFS